MLVNLTPNIEEIERRKVIATEHNFEFIPQSDPKWLQETGIYQSSFAFNFCEDEFMEKLDGYYYSESKKKPEESPLQHYSQNYKNWVKQYGVADNIEQIKEFYKKQIKNKKEKFCIAVTPVWQNRENRGKGGGWRWHKWGEYIGKLNPQHEYLDDEDFGEDFQYVLCFHLYFVKETTKV